jgi:hypothetical protein
MTQLSPSRRAAGAVIAVVFAILTTLGVVSPALAGTASSSQCASGQFCVWSGSLFGGTIWPTSASGTVEAPSAVRNSASVLNLNAHAVRVYSGAGATGSSVCYLPGANLASTAVTVGSVRILTTSAC